MTQKPTEEQPPADIKVDPSAEARPPLDYSNIKPEEDGRAWYIPPPGWEPPKGEPLPIVEGVSESDYEDIVRELLLPSVDFWRSRATSQGFRKFAKAKKKAEQALVNSAFQLSPDGSPPTLDNCIPTGSLLAEVDRYFWEYTDIPRELPFFFVLHYVMATLLQQGVEIHKGKQVILPDMWTIVVAPSGAGKSMSQKELAKAFDGDVNMFPDAKTSLQFLTNLRDHRLGLYVKDEFAQFLKSISKDSSMQDVRDYLLRTYDNAKIQHTTTVSSVEVEESAIGILGYTPVDTLTKYLTPEMLLDGFAQRFSYCVADPDDREIVGDYDFDELASRIRPHWKKITSTPFHPVYKIEQEGRSVFNHIVKIIVSRARQEGINDSFSRRLAFSTYKYGLAYHVIRGNPSDTITPEELDLGAQLTALHLNHLSRVMDLYGVRKTKQGAEPQSQTPTATVNARAALAATAVPSAPQASAAISTADKLAKVQAFLQKQKATNADPISLSKLQSSIRALRGSAAETRTLAAQVVATDPSLAPFIVL